MNTKPFTVPHRLQTLYPLLSVATAELSTRLGRAPNASELAAELGLCREYVIAALIEVWHDDTPSTDSCRGEDHRLAAAVPAFGTGVEAFDNGEWSQRLIADLPRYARAVVLMRFGGAMTQTQIAERLGVSQLCVSRLLATALDRVRRNEMRV